MEPMSPMIYKCSTTAPAAKQTSNAGATSERRKNAITLSAIGAVVAAVMLLMELGTPAPEQSSDPARAPEQTITGEGQGKPPAESAGDTKQLTTTGHQTTQSDNKVANEPLIAQPSAPSPRTEQTIAPCAGATELLRARLRWQLPTDLEPCAG